MPEAVKGIFHGGFAEYVYGLLARESIETLDMCTRPDLAPRDKTDADQ